MGGLIKQESRVYILYKYFIKDMFIYIYIHYSDSDLFNMNLPPAKLQWHAIEKVLSPGPNDIQLSKLLAVTVIHRNHASSSK